MANLARSVHSSNNHFQRKTENSKKREEREEKGGRGRQRGYITPFLAQTYNHTFSSSNLSQAGSKARMGSGRLFMVMTSAIGVILTFAMEAR